MKKNLIIALLSVITLCSLFYSLYQKTEAKKAQKEALALAELALRNESLAIREKEAADMARMAAEKFRADTQKQLEDCARNKK